jgi:hypothetical protein
MLEVIGRVIALLAALWLGADSLLPGERQRVRVDRHAVDEQRTTGSSGRSVVTARYTLYFVDARTPSCAVGETAYEALEDGDEALLVTSRLSHACLRLASGDRELMPVEHRWVEIAIAAVLLAIAFGWLPGPWDWRSDDDEWVIDEYGYRVPRPQRRGWYL